MPSHPPRTSKRRRAKAAARTAVRNKPLQYVARAGLVASGLLNLTLGVISIAIVFGADDRGDQGGALEQLAGLIGGQLLLAVAALALFTLAAWQAIQVVSVREPKLVLRWWFRMRHAAQAIGYGTVAVLAVRFALLGRNGRADTRVLSKAVLDLPGGQLIIAGIGALVVIAGGAFVVVGIRRTFLKNDVKPPTAAARRAVAVAGTIGYLGRGVVLGILGTLWVVSAIALDPRQTEGLDGALARLANVPFGVFLLVAIAIGFVAFAAYCALRARWPRFDG